MKNKKNDFFKSFKLIQNNFTHDKKGGENKIKNKKTISLFGISLALIMILGSTPLGFAEPLRVQLEQGIETDQLQCNNPNHVLVQRSNGSPACVSESTAEKLGWGIIKTEFNFVPDESILPVIDESSLPQTTEQELMFAITSDVEFDGELYGYYEPQVLRRPAPTDMSTFFAKDHYDVKQTVQDSVSLMASGQLTTNSLLEQLVTSSSVHENAIDYQQWLPTTIPEGFELKWIDINQPEVYGDNMGQIDIKYYPNTVDVFGNMLNIEVADIAQIGIQVYVYPYDADPYPQSRIDFATKNGTSTQVFVEEKYGGFLETIVESPANPASKGFSLYTNEYMLGVGGKGLTLEEYEKIFLEILERQ